jgi:hypothetical protein
MFQRIHLLLRKFRSSEKIIVQKTRPILEKTRPRRCVKLRLLYSAPAGKFRPACDQESRPLIRAKINAAKLFRAEIQIGGFSRANYKS